MAKDNKTNVCRLLDKAKIPYVEQEYPVDEEDLSGAHVASVLGFPPEIIYKTLVLKGDKTGYFVAVIPVLEEVDLKKAAKVSQNKKAEMIPMKDLQPLTGYIRGGCSPIGMKKHFPTYFQKQGGSWKESMFPPVREACKSACLQRPYVLLCPEALRI